MKMVATVVSGEEAMMVWRSWSPCPGDNAIAALRVTARLLLRGTFRGATPHVAHHIRWLPLDRSKEEPIQEHAFLARLEEQNDKR